MKPLSELHYLIELEIKENCKIKDISGGQGRAAARGMIISIEWKKNEMK